MFFVKNFVNFVVRLAHNVRFYDFWAECHRGIAYAEMKQPEEVRQMFDSHSELNIESIAEKCGFKTCRSFYRAFCEHYKLNPAAYRKMAKRDSFA